MHCNLKLSALAAAAVILAGCGGSDSDSPATPSAAYAGTVLAGVASGSDYSPGDTEPGCTDGAALGAKLQPSHGAIAHAGDGHLVLPELSSCDGRIRIRATDPAANTLKTLAMGAVLPENSQEALTTFLTPTSIVTTPSGEIYVADSDPITGQMPSTRRQVPGRGSGIWKLGTNGNVSLLAGVALPSVGMSGTGVDGQGTAASFGYLMGMCWGSDGVLYVTDNNRLRTVSVGGLVSTVAASAGAIHQAVLACGPDGSMLVRRWFQNPADDDYYDPIGRKSIAKASVVGRDFSPLAYFGASNPSVVIQTGSTSPTLALLSLTDGSTATIAKIASPADLAATPPSLAEVVRAGIAINNQDFALLTNRAVFQFTRK